MTNLQPIDTDAIKCIVARLQALPAGQSSPIRGTAFLVSHNRLLTCAHCVSRDGKQADSVDLWFNHGPHKGQTTAKVVAADADKDVALLELVQPTTAKLLPVQMIPVVDSLWKAFGYPSPAGTDGIMLDGAISDPTARAYERHAIQLHCSQAQEPVRGASGAPIVVDGCVVGMLNLQLLGYRGAEEKPFYSVVYAVPLAAVEGLGGEFKITVDEAIKTAPDPCLIILTKPVGTLDGLFKRLFSPHEVRDFLRTGPSGEDVCNALPTGSPTMDELCSGAEGVLDRFGLINNQLFIRLKGKRPGKAAEIDKVRRLWLG